jgi:molybdate transport system substrate-binding protein
MRATMTMAFGMITLATVLGAPPSRQERGQQPPNAAGAAAQITVLSSNGFQAVMEELGPRFERAKNLRVVVSYDLASTHRQRIEAGQAFDLAILTPAAIDDLVKAGKIAGSSRTTLARSGLGLAVRAGAPKPDVATNESFRRTLADAKSLAYVKEGASGVAFAALVQRLGMTETLKAKSQLLATRDEVGDAVRNGKAQFGVLPISEILPLAGTELAGAFPQDLQAYIVMEAGASATTTNSSAVRELVQFLTASDALPIITAKGMERVPPR